MSKNSNNKKHSNQVFALLALSTLLGLLAFLVSGNALINATKSPDSPTRNTMLLGSDSSLTLSALTSFNSIQRRYCMDCDSFSIEISTKKTKLKDQIKQAKNGYNFLGTLTIKDQGQSFPQIPIKIPEVSNHSKLFIGGDSLILSLNEAQLLNTYIFEQVQNNVNDSLSNLSFSFDIKQAVIFPEIYFNGKWIGVPVENRLIPKAEFERKKISIFNNSKKESSKKEITKYYLLNYKHSVLKWIGFHSGALGFGYALIPFFFILIFQIIKEVNQKSEARLDHKFPIRIFLVSLLLVALSSLFTFLILRGDNVNLLSGADIMADFNIVFYDPNLTIGILVVFFMIVGIPPLLGMLMIVWATAKLWNEKGSLDEDENKKITETLAAQSTKDESGQQPKREDLEKPIRDGKLVKLYLSIRDKLNVFAFFSGCLVALSILGSRLQRDMIMDYIPDVKEIYPDLFTYLYGLVFTLLLAMFFLPAQFFLKYFKDERGIAVEAKPESGKWWKIGTESIQDIKLIFALVLPLLTTAVTSFF
ncbi:MAG: hypothetical protein MRZ79_20980 [Bacteroidia bacterium]|nr:hypothetical protein [Bacteroidia bacterium]